MNGSFWNWRRNKVLKLLIKKQMTEVFRSYFFDAKKNRMRSKGSIAAMFVFFILLMVCTLL